MSEPLARLLQVHMPYGKYKGTLIARQPLTHGAQRSCTPYENPNLLLSGTT